jgi:O-antigen/teichoic acid export membrane protein
MSVAKNTLRGVAWGALGSIIGKLAGLAAQFILGWILTKEDFAIYAIGISFSSIVSCLNNGGTQKILIQKGNEYNFLAWGIFNISIIFNVIILITLVIGAKPIAEYYQLPQLTLIISLLGLSVFLATPGFIFHAKLMGELRFRTTQILAICSHIIKHGSSVIFAYLGFGSLSLVLPLIVIAITDSILSGLVVKKLPLRRNMSYQEVLTILNSSKWIIASSLAASLVQNGDNLAISLTADKLTLGVYFFAYQLTFSFASLLGGSLQSVLMPTFVNFKSDIERHGSALLKASSILIIITSMASFSLLIVAEPIVDILWKGKWNEAISVIQILCFSLPFVILSSVSKASIEAMGSWKLVSLLSLFEGVSTVLAAMMGGLFGTLVDIASFVALIKIISSVVQLFFAIKGLNGNFIKIIWYIFGVYIAVSISVIPFMYSKFTGLTLCSCSIQINYLIHLFLFLIISSALLLVFYRSGCKELLSLLRINRLFNK